MSTASPTFVNTAPCVTAIEQRWEQEAAHAADSLVPGLEAREQYRAFLSWTNEQKDQALIELIRSSQAGSDFAQLTILRLFVGKAVKFARSCRGLVVLDLPSAVDQALSAFVIAIAEYPVTKQTKVASHLTLRVLQILDAENTSTIPACAGSEEMLGAMVVEESVSSERELAETLAWALESGYLTAEEIRILTYYYLAENLTIRDQRADELGISPLAFQKRASRCRSKLVRAIRRHIDATGTW